MSTELTHRLDEARARQDLPRASLVKIAITDYLDKIEQEVRL